ncbi:MAG: hypothetical protein Q9218_007781 [Villophora microphyllina]
MAFHVGDLVWVSGRDLHAPCSANPTRALHESRMNGRWIKSWAPEVTNNVWSIKLNGLASNAIQPGTLLHSSNMPKTKFTNSMKATPTQSEPDHCDILRKPLPLPLPPPILPDRVYAEWFQRAGSVTPCWQRAWPPS